MSVDSREQENGTGFTFPVARSSMSNLAEKIELTFDRMGYRSLRNVYCETNGSHVTLKGKTSTFYLKQVAQVIATKVGGVTSISNQIEVMV